MNVNIFDVYPVLFQLSKIKWFIFFVTAIPTIVNF